MQTESVDKELEEGLNAELPTIGERIKNNDGDEEESSDHEDGTPISEYTKNLIACKFSNSLRADPAIMGKMINCIKHIEKMSEAEARKYLAVLNNTNVSDMSNSTVDFVLKNISNYFINPAREDIKSDILKDKFIRMMMSDKLTALFLYLGDMAGVILFVMYSMDSWYGNNQNKNEKENNAG